jgi:hypothetical protein
MGLTKDDGDFEQRLLMLMRSMYKTGERRKNLPDRRADFSCTGIFGIPTISFNRR